MRRRWLRRAAIIVLGTGLVLGLALAGAGWLLLHRYTSNVTRIPDVFSGLDEAERPADTDAVTFLLIGSDVRAPGPTTGSDATASGVSRADVIMLVRIAGDRESVTLASIPRDSWVRIPGHGMNKINAAYAFGGASLLVRTVEQVTDVRIDHFAAIDFHGFKAMTAALGGVTVQVRERITYGPYVFTEGLNHLNGEEALAYVRQRKKLPKGDLDRIQRQQQYLQAMASKVLSRETLSNPSRLDDFLLALTSAVSVDDTLSSVDLFQLAFSLRSLSMDAVHFFTVPVNGTGWEGDQSVVYLDRDAANRFWRLFETGRLPKHTDEFVTLPEVPY